METVRTVKLPKKISEIIVMIPENGMNYHVLNVILNSGRVLKNRIIINSEALILERNEEIQTEEIQTISL